jgi:dipeptide/tripeptide permease
MKKIEIVVLVLVLVLVGVGELMVSLTRQWSLCRVR